LPPGSWSVGAKKSREIVYKAKPGPGRREGRRQGVEEVHFPSKKIRRLLGGISKVSGMGPGKKKRAAGTATWNQRKESGVET